MTGPVPLPDVATAPAIPGLAVRFFHDASDFAGIADVMAAANLVDDIPYLPTPRALEIEMAAADGTNPATDVVIVEVDGRIVAQASVERTVREEIPTYQVHGFVHPDLRRRGLGTWLQRWTIDRARTRASREDPTGPVRLASWSEDVEAGHVALLANAGFATVRHFFLMKRGDLDDVPEAPLPDGLEIRPVEESHRRAILEAENEAFRDHWGHREMTESTYTSTFTRPELDTDLWIVAWDGDQIAGVVQNWIWPEENERLGVERGWLEHISVRRPWRRRGLARAITAASLVRLREAGMVEGMLGVDSENPNGALGLYEGLGFEVRSQAAAYRRDLER
ncbi:MAG TPA: GNAT family N-acetyltransferase [Candidatus Limnocylindrales bacterium]